MRSTWVSPLVAIAMALGTSEFGLHRIRVDVVDAIALQERGHTGFRRLRTRVGKQRVLWSTQEEWAGGVGRRLAARHPSEEVSLEAHRHDAPSSMGVKPE